MRVLRVTGGLDEAFGGPAFSTVLSCLATRRAGLDVTLCYAGEGGASTPTERRLTEPLAAEGIEVRRFRLTRLGPFAKSWGVSSAQAAWLWRHARDYDVVHAHGAWTLATLAALLAARRARTAAVLTPHETLTAFDLTGSRAVIRLAKLVLRALFARAFDAVVVASELEAADVPAAARTHVVPHPVEAAEGSAKRAHEEGLRLGYLGRFHAKKNVPVLLEALAGLQPSTTLALAGDGPPELREALKRTAEKLGVADRVRWLGFLSGSAKSDFLRGVDLLVMPSEYECFGMAVAEALAAGVPVVVSPTTGLARLVEEHGAGRVVPPEPGVLAEALREVEQRPELLDEWRARARVAAERSLSLETHGERLRAVYDSLARPTSRAALAAAGKSLP